MRREPHRKSIVPFRTISHFTSAALVLAMGLGCGSAADDRFAAETYDEYTTPLTNVTIGEGAKTIVIGDLAAADAGPDPLPGKADAGVIGGGSGGAGIGGTGGSFDGGGGSSVGNGFGPTGFWHFDDCSPASHFLADSSGNGFAAQHDLNRFCVDGISGLGIDFVTAKDIVQVPDEPQFTVGQRVAVAAWVKPTDVTGNHPIVLKRLNNTTSFSLGIHNQNLEMAVQLTNGHTFISRAPIEPNVFTHVAGMYDGRFVFLFINGEQVGQVASAGTLNNVFAPIRIGATTQSQHFSGTIDEVWLSTNVVSKEEVMALSCIHRPLTVAATPATSGLVQPGTMVHYDVSVKNQDIGACQFANYELFVDLSARSGGAGGGAGTTVTTTTGAGGAGMTVTTTTGFGGSATATTVGSGAGGGSIADGGIGRAGAGGADAGSGGTVGSGGTGGSGGFVSNIGITANVNPSFAFGIPPGAMTTFGIDVNSTEDADPGVHHIPFNVFNFGQFFEFVSGEVLYELAPQTGCFVRTRRELMITDLSVVEDPVRTGGGPTFPFDAGVAPAAPGVWTFGRLMRDMAPTPEAAPAMVESLLKTWLTDQTVNGFTVPARPAMQQLVLDGFPRSADGSLDIDRAPLRLLAIVNRMDLRNLANHNAGEGRFVFGVLQGGPFGFPLQFTVILEYKLPAETDADVTEWANLWHGLSSHPFPSEEYNAALEAITMKFSKRGASPAGVNGSALSQLRTNEIAISSNGRWELREFALSADTGFLKETTVKLTPDLGFNGTSTLADFVNQNEAAILGENVSQTTTIPEQLNGSHFLAGSIFNDLIQWQAPGILNPDARFNLSLNTCNGCHGPEAGIFDFLQIHPRFPGQETFLSGFLTGTTVFDPFSGQVRTLNDLAQRNAGLKAIVCGPVSSAVLAKGSARVH